MRNIGELNKEELIIYSKVLVELSNTLLQNREFAMNFMHGVQGKKFVKFPIEWAGIMTFDREERQFSYKDILIPKSIFDEIIEYGIVIQSPKFN